MIELHFSTGEPVLAPTLRLYHREPNKGAVVLIDDQVGKTWACSVKKLPTGSVASISIPGQDEPVRMRILGPANRKELQAALQRVKAKATFARGHWYEVHAD